MDHEMLCRLLDDLHACEDDARLCMHVGLVDLAKDAEEKKAAIEEQIKALRACDEGAP